MNTTSKPSTSCRGDHEWQFCSEPHEQAGGTVEINFEQCIRCDATRELEPDFTPDYDPPEPRDWLNEYERNLEFGGIG